MFLLRSVWLIWMLCKVVSVVLFTMGFRAVNVKFEMMESATVVAVRMKTKGLLASWDVFGRSFTSQTEGQEE